MRNPKLGLLSIYLFSLLSTHLHMEIMLFWGVSTSTLLIEPSASVTNVYMQIAEHNLCFLMWHFSLSSSSKIYNSDCYGLINKLCLLQNSCWRSNLQTLQMWLYLEIGSFKGN